MQRKQGLEHLQSRIISGFERNVSTKKQKYISITAKLDAMSPLKVLSRGYSMTQDTHGNLISSVSQVQPDISIRITLSDGTFSAIVTNKENDHGTEEKL